MDDDRRSGQESGGGRAAAGGAFGAAAHADNDPGEANTLLLAVGSTSRRSLAAIGTDIEIEIELAASDASFDWSDEQTARFDFDKSMLTPEDKLVIGYLLMEEHGLFAALPVDEQLDVVGRLRR